jgi:hypothetical protein
MPDLWLCQSGSGCFFLLKRSADLSDLRPGDQMPDSLLIRFRILSRTQDRPWTPASPDPDVFFYFSALLTCLIAGPGIKVVIVQIVQRHRVELGGGRVQIDQLIVGRGIVLHARLTRVKAVKKLILKNHSRNFRSKNHCGK